MIDDETIPRMQECPAFDFCTSPKNASIAECNKQQVPVPSTTSGSFVNRKQTYFPYECQVRLSESQTVVVRATTVNDFWKDIHFAFQQSIFRDFAGIVKSEGQEILPPDAKSVEPGRYSLVARSHYWSDEELDEILWTAVEKLNAFRPFLSHDILHPLEDELFLQSTHFSLNHEGNALTMDEVRVLTELVGKDHWTHHVREDEEAARMCVSKSDVREAINYIGLSQDLKKTIEEEELTEELVFDLHARLMQGLLHKEEEGLAGIYRKVKVGVSGRTTQTEHPDLISYSMEEFFEETLIREKDERIFDYLARVHTDFQYIYPFRDGNGHMGRIIVNILLLKHGYPIMVLPTALSSLVNHAVSLGVHGQECHRVGGDDESHDGAKLFARLLAEAVFSSLQTYEHVLGTHLLPTIDDVLRDVESSKSLASASRSNVVSPAE